MTVEDRPSARAGAFRIVAEVQRGGVAESWHAGVAAVCQPDGAIVGRCGDPRLATFVRSAAKPFQALPLLAAGGVERFSLEPADLALICASHSGAPEHVDRARAILARGGFTQRDLRCGAHPPFDPRVAERLQAAGGQPGSLHNNCSGKHAGQLLSCRALGMQPGGYDLADHPLQVRVRAELDRFFEVDTARHVCAIDGCSLPTYHLPVLALARAYAKLADPRAAGLDDKTAGLVDTIFTAMAGAPEMVAGPGRFTTRLIAECGGRLIGKEGAEGVYALAVRRPRPLGIALKIADGGERCRDAVVVDLLRKLDLVDAGEVAAVGEAAGGTLRNWRGLEVGVLVADVPLEA